MPRGHNTHKHKLQTSTSVRQFAGLCSSSANSYRHKNLFATTTMAPSSTTSMVLMAGSALLATAAASQFFSSSSKDRSIVEIEDDDVEYITQDDVCKIFERLFLEMQGVMAQLSQQVQQIQMSGQQIPEAHLRELLKREFENALTVKQGMVFEEFGVDADCLEEAVWEFMNEEDKKVVKAVERFQKLYENVSGEKVVGRRPGKELVEEDIGELLDVEGTVEAAKIFFGALTMRMKELVQECQEQGKSLQDPAVAQELNVNFSTTGNEAGEDALKEQGISLKVFQASIENNAANPSVGRALQMLQIQQQQELMSMGVPMGPGM